MSSYREKLRTSWELMGRSLSVLRQNPKLFLFPVVSTLCGLAIIVFFFAPLLVLVGGGVWAGRTLHVDWHEVGVQLGIFFHTFGYLIGVAIYVVSMVVATFMNVAFYHEIMRALAGEPVSVGSGLRFAAGKWRPILMWSLLASTVGLIIRALEERLGFIGRIVLALVGTAWSVAAVFAIPVIIRRDESNPLNVLRDSVATLKRTWGESLAGWVGIQLGGFVFLALTLGLLVPAGMLAIGLHQFWLLFAALAVWILATIVASFLFGMATHVYRCALYVYASEGVVPGPYTADMMNAAWKVKKT